MMTPRLSALFVMVGILSGCGPSGSANDASQYPEATMAELNQALQTWYFHKVSYPSNMEDLVGAPFFKKKLPTPPPGKKLVLDRNGKAVFVSE